MHVLETILVYVDLFVAREMNLLLGIQRFAGWWREGSRVKNSLMQT